MTTRRERQKTDLLEHYAQREPKAFYQIDGFAQDGTVSADADGDVVTISPTYELMTDTQTLEILITAGASKADVLRLLRKIRKLVKRYGFGSVRRELESQDAWLAQRVCLTCGAPLADEQPDIPF